MHEDNILWSLLLHTLSYLPSTPSAPAPPYKSLSCDHIFCFVLWPAEFVQGHLMVGLPVSVQLET